MWSQLVLCCLVGFAFASNNPAWKDNTEYTYKVHGRTLASLNEVANQYTGILFKAHLTVQPKSDGNLIAKVSDVQYAQIHTRLANGWNTVIPEGEVTYKPLPMSNKPFQIVMEDGVIRDLMVNKDISNWESNIIRSIVSQFQLDTKGKNLIPSHINTLPEGQNNNAVFKTMEDTINGESETLYDIHPLGEEYVLEFPWMVPQKQLIGDGEIIEIVRTKNFTNSKQRPSYHYGLGGMMGWEPAGNQMGQFLTRNSVSRTVVTGKLDRFTVQNSYTVNKIVINPTFTDKQRGSVVSMVNITLAEVRPQTQQPQEVTNPISLGSLVYRFNSPFSTDDHVRPASTRQEYRQEDSNEYMGYHPRFRRSIPQDLRAQVDSQYLPQNIEQYWAEQQQQPEPKINEPSPNPFLGSYIGYMGKSIKQQDQQKLKDLVIQSSKLIGQYVQLPETIFKQYVTDRFVKLQRFVSLMTLQQHEEVSQALYNAKEGQERAAWVAYRDAVAVSGTGPALLIVTQWIETDKVRGIEAATLVAVMSNNVQEPTQEYISHFYKLTQLPKTQEQHHLRNTAVLSLANLLRTVNSNKSGSHSQYPVHTYGRFRSVENVKYMRETIIPHFAKQLQQAVKDGKTVEIHLYTEALGRIADKEILSVFEPYLEGTMQMSQFQRLHMVISMNQISVLYPELVRSVAYKIYQNPQEEEKVRIAAIYILVKTQPPQEILAKMAEDTHTIEHENIVAAIRSSILSASELEGERYWQLRSHASSVKHLLKQQIPGATKPYNYLRDYIVERQKEGRKENVQEIPSVGSYFPSFLKYSTINYASGLFTHSGMNVMVSGVDQLFTELEKQTESYETLRQAAEKASQHNWSSSRVAQKINLDAPEMEQLEMLLNLNMGHLQYMNVQDNKTIEQLPKHIQEWQQELKQGKHFNHLKFIDGERIILAFPTEMGLPFVYTYNKPAVLRFHGKIQAVAQPEVSQGNKLHKPNTISAKIDATATVQVEERGHLSFITPFEHQQYVAGYEGSLLVNVPLRVNAEIDVQKMQVKAEIEPLNEQGKETPIVRFETRPFTSVADLINGEPIALRPTTKVITERFIQGQDEVYGKKSTGMAFRIRSQHMQQRNNLMWPETFLRTKNVFATLQQLVDLNTIQYRKLSIDYLPEQSVNRKLTVKLGYQQEYRTQAQDESNESQSSDLKQLAKTPSESMGRQQDFIKKAGAGIHSVKAKVVDVELDFQGEQPIKYTVTGALAKSNVDPKSRVLFRYRKQVEKTDNKPFEFVLSAKSEIPNTNGLDLTDSLKTEPKINTHVRFAFGQNIDDSSSEIESEIAFRRSDDRKQYLVDLPMYHQCKRDMQEGNHQLPACANLTISANLLNDVEIKMQHKNLRPEFIARAQGIYGGIRYGMPFLPFVSVHQSPETQGNQVHLHAHFAPNLKSVNVTVKANQEKTIFEDILVNEWAKTLLVQQPVFHLKSRVYGKILGYPGFRKVCVVDQNKANTFTNKTYGIETLGNQWTVMMQYVPQRARQHQQKQITGEELLKHELDNYLVLVRNNKENPKNKDIKITFSDKRTNGEVIEITMQPTQSGQHSGSSPRAKVLVGQQQVQFNDRQSHDIQKDLVQIYALPNGEVKVEVNSRFYVIYDGQRAKLTLLDGRFRSQVLGLCGQNKDSKTIDFRTPDDCLVRDPREFVQSYNVEQPQQQRKHCTKQEIRYVNVVSNQDAGRGLETKYGQSSSMYTRYQTRYVKQEGDNEICFTRRQYPACTNGATPRGTVSKNVSVHCVKKSSVAQLWKDQIDNGQSPNFSGKPESKQLPLNIPQECAP